MQSLVLFFDFFNERDRWLKKKSLSHLNTTGVEKQFVKAGMFLIKNPNIKSTRHQLNLPAG
jgi:hypothetical protein